VLRIDTQALRPTLRVGLGLCVIIDTQLATLPTQQSRGGGTMGKKRKTFSLDEEVQEELAEREHLNASSLANEFFRQYLFQGEDTDAALQMRKKDLDREIESLRQEKGHIQSKIERKQNEREEVKDLIKQRRREGYKDIQEFIDEVLAHPERQLEVDNPAVKNYAQKANMTPERFIREVEEQL